MSAALPDTATTPPAATEPGRVSVIVVSWNTRELLRRCLGSLALEVEGGRAEVCVVDNGSSDGSLQAAREWAPWARVIEAEENLGFGRAVNLAARDASGEWIACANADVELRPGALERMLAAGAAADVGCVAPLLELSDGEPQHSVHSLPTLGFALALNLGLPRLRAGLGDRLLLAGHYDPLQAREVPWALGAFLLVRREAFAAVGGFDERQWMYAEDLDLCWRLRDRGWRIVYEPRARVRHASGAATEQVFEDRPGRFMRATYAVIVRRRGVLAAWSTAAVNVLGAGARAVAWAAVARLSRRGRARRDECLMWARAHAEGLRRPSQLREFS